MNQPRLTLVIAILIVLALVAVFFPRGGSNEDPESASGPRERRSAAPPAASAESPRNRTAAAASNRPREPLPAHQVDDLPKFILPLVEGRELTLKGAVKSLMEAYKDACHRSRTEPLALDFALPEDASRRFSFSIERGDFQAALAHLAALAGYTVNTDGLRVSFEPVPADTELYSRTFPVKPGLSEALASQLGRLGLPHDASLAAMAASAGLANPERSLTLSPNGLLLTSLTAPEMLKLETWLATLPAAVQFKASVKWIHTDQPIAIDPRTATREDILEWLRTLANQPGASVVQAPNVTMREMQESTIDIIKGTPTEWTGTRISIEAERGGLSILAKDTTEYRPEDHSTPPVRNTSQSVVRDGEPQLSLVSNRDGSAFYRVLTLERIDATGRPANENDGSEDGPPVAKALPDKPGFVLSPFNNQLIDVRDLPSGSLVRDPTYPASERKIFRIP